MKQKKPHSDKYVVGRSLSTGAYSSPPAVPQPAAVNPEQPPIEKVHKKRSIKKIILIIITLLLIPVLIIGIWDATNLSRASKKMFDNGNLLAALMPTSLEGTERDRVNILVVGYSADDPGHAGANLTDSIMVVSLSTKNKTGYMLSIPRDLYVAIPDYGRAKINEAYQRGETNGFSESGYPAGGIGLLEKTISNSLEIPIDYYAIINYAAVRDTTDALGGITVNIQSTDPRGIYDPNFKPQEGGPLKLANGPQTVDGQTALRLSRARGSTAGAYGLAQSDFDRTKNQQQVLLGMKQALGPSVILDPRKNNDVLDAIASNVKTDIEINEVIPLYRLFNGVPEGQLQSVNLRDFNKQNLLASYTTPTGQSALIPAAGVNDYSDIQAAITQLNRQ